MSNVVQWRIELLGGFRAQSRERLVSRFRTRNAGVLLARLALERGPVRRDDLVEWLWPDCDFVAGRGRLSGALSALRRELENPHALVEDRLFLATHDTIELNPRLFGCDAHEFEALVKRADAEAGSTRIRTLEEALSLWRGPLWNGEYFAWLREEAARLGELHCKAALSLAQLDAARATEVLLAAHKIWPGREDIARPLLSALAGANRGEDARRVWRNLEEALLREWNRAPSPPLRAVAKRLLEPPAPCETILGEPLPPRVNRFFGRETERETLSAWLSAPEKGRLLTISGGAGHGKTRLAVEAARQNVGLFGGLVCFVSLLGESDARHLLDAVGDALHAPRAMGQSALERIAQALETKRVLLLLDNFEHLIEAAPEVERLLARVSNAVCLVTSRRKLEVAGERELSLDPLPIPALEAASQSRRRAGTSNDEREMTPDEWARNPAMRLFVERARAQSPEFALHADNAPEVARLCRALGGVPLALELAAARTLSLSPSQIERELQIRLDVLRGPINRCDERHTGLHAALDWSFHLLSVQARRVFCRLGIFHGSWTLERALVVCTDSRDNADVVARSHEELRRHSLLEADEAEGELRFRFVETVRLYALERAATARKQAWKMALEQRHAHEFARLMTVVSRPMHGPISGDWSRQLERDLFDLRAALEWALNNDSVLALQMSASLWWFWFATSRLDEGRSFLGRALEGSQEIASTSGEDWRARVQSGAGFLAWRQGDLEEAIKLCSQAVTSARAANDEEALSYALIVLDMAAVVGGDFEAARSMGEECLELARAAGDQYAQAFALHLLGVEADLTGDSRRGQGLQQQSVALFGAIGAPEGRAWALFNGGNAARHEGNFEQAVALCDQSRELFQSLSSREGVAYCDLFAALSHRDAGQNERALPLCREALRVLWELRASWGLAMALECTATLGFHQTPDSANASLRLWSAARLVRERIGTPVPPVETLAFATFEEELRAALPVWSFEAARETGRTLSLEQSVQFALELLNGA